MRNPGALPIGAGATVEEFLRFWLENYGETKLRPTTLANYRAIIAKHIFPVIGALKLEELSWQHLQALYRTKQQEGLSARTVRLIHAIMHRALGWASDEKRRILFENVAEAAEPPALVPKEVEPLTEEEAVRLLAAAYEDRYYATFVLAATLGMRRGEILALTWDNVDLENGVLYVTRSLVLVDGKIHFQLKRIDEALDRLDAEIWRVLAGPKRGFNGPEGGWPYETGIMVVDCKPRA